MLFRSTLAAACEDGRVGVWDTVSLGTPDAPPRVAIAHGAPVRGVAILAAGERVALAADDGLVTYDVATGKEGERQPPVPGQSAVAAAAGAIVTGAADGIVRVTTPALDRLRFLGDAPAEGCTGLASLPGDGGLVVLGSGAAGLRRFAPDGTPAPALFADVVPARMATSGDGARIAIVDAAGNLATWTTADGSRAGPFPVGPGVTALAFSRDGAQVVVADGAPRLRAFATGTGRLVEEVAIGAPALAVAVTGADGRSWAAFGREPQGTLVRRSWVASLIDGTTPIRALAVTPDGARAFAGLADGRIVEVARGGGDPVRTLVGSEAAISSL